MLKPQSNAFRQVIQLANFWDFRFDPDEIGKEAGWNNGFNHSVPIAVPASWNDQFMEERDNLGPAWYQTKFDLPWGWQEKSVFLRFDSVNYLAEVWLNGVHLGEHEGGHLPFVFEIGSKVKPENNLLVVRVDGSLAFDRVPPGDIPPVPGQDNSTQNFPPTNFDFYPFCGIQRPVLLYAMPQNGLVDLTVIPDIDGDTGIVNVTITLNGDVDTIDATISVQDDDSLIITESLPAPEKKIMLAIPHAKLWSPESPNLYRLVIELACDNLNYDSYSLDIGIRTMKVEGDQLLLNGKPVFLRGFGRHEDFPVIGRGLFPALIIKDYALMEWVGANSFRTTHYPYSEEMIDMADRLGFMVIDETPGVGLFFDEPGLDKRFRLCQQFTRELIDRDKNHPSVIVWSLANEPHSIEPAASQFFRGLYDLAKSLDDTRPVTLVSSVGKGEVSFEFLDIVCLNRYYGWYSEMGLLDIGMKLLSNELDALHAQYPKPLLLTEFGADAVPGMHAQPAEMFSEEYQAEMIEAYLQLLNSKPYVAGQHVWNLCDFKTGQSVRRMAGFNYKGIFTRDRRPKLAAHRLKASWTKS